jgi:expansin (peptidoglycan-binding protein)
VAVAAAGAVVVLVALAVGISQATAAPACASVIAPAAQTSGQATHYELAPGGMGNCSYPSPPADQLYVALSPPEYGGAAACGSYLQVTGPDGSVTAEVIDQCPECQAGHIDLSEQAFARIAPLSAGLVPVSYHTIADPPLPAPLFMVVKTGSSAYYLALLPVNNGNPLATVAVREGSGGWQELARTTYGYWLASSGAGPGPFTVRLTDSLGHQATVNGITISPGVVQSTGTSMYGAGAAAPVDTTAPAAPAKKAPRTRRAGHRHHAAHATTSPAPTGGFSVAGASARPAAASPTPSCH